MKCYVVYGISREYPEDHKEWIFSVYTDKEKAETMRDTLNQESARIFKLSPWSKIVEAIQISSDPDMKHGDDAAEYYVQEVEMDRE